MRSKEEILIRLWDTDIITVTGLGPVQADGSNARVETRRAIEIMARGLGRLIGLSFDEEEAPKLLARMTHLALSEMAETLEEKTREG